MTDLVVKLRGVLGEVLEGPGLAEKSRGWSRVGTPDAILRPRSTAEVSAALKLCHAARQPVVPWGGRTGLVEGARSDHAIALSLERMNAIEDIDVEGATLTAQAGCVLQTVCEAAEERGMFFPLDLGARGSATIGGNIATNAGGNRVIRYGMMRELLLGLEVVLADGEIVSSMNHLIKNNAGYDPKQIFVGSEGTLGVVTRAVLRLRPKPASQNTAFVAVSSFEVLPRLLRQVERGLGGTLSAFEVLWR
ncbi:MAG: FAD-binding oxidoreductase, partial [Alphaproteobacteria bacterium]|nr:FAD-binding oxidoreductase [Alphaproteobacteria bacterium]